MDAHFSFKTTAFDDPPTIRESTVNGIVGHALATWLAAAVRTSGFTASEPWSEDHGWDFSIVHDDAKYLCVCSIDTEGDAPYEAHVSVSRHLSLWQRLTSKAPAGPDPVVDAIGKTLAASRDVSGLERQT